MAKKKSEKEEKKIKKQTLEDAANVANVTIDQEESDQTTKEIDTAEETLEESKPEEVEEKPKKQKRVVKIRKSKKEREHPLSIAIRLAVESGKVEYGSKSAIKDALLGKAKVFIVASKAPVQIRENIETYCKMSNTPIIPFDGTPLELGVACGKPFNVAIFTIYDAGSSSIMELTKKK